MVLLHGSVQANATTSQEDGVISSEDDQIIPNEVHEYTVSVGSMRWLFAVHLGLLELSPELKDKCSNHRIARLIGLTNDNPFTFKDLSTYLYGNSFTVTGWSPMDILDRYRDFLSIAMKYEFGKEQFFSEEMNFQAWIISDMTAYLKNVTIGADGLNIVSVFKSFNRLYRQLDKAYPTPTLDHGYWNYSTLYRPPDIDEALFRQCVWNARRSLVPGDHGIQWIRPLRRNHCVRRQRQ